MGQTRPASILRILGEAGHEAWYVGGCVRDSLLGRPIHDWDITTSALPEQILTLFPHCVPTGIKHGTVTVLAADGQAEVTTYRTESGYADGRHPDQVAFVSNIEEDLSRRDFTINAMAMSDAGEILDLFGGKDDLAVGTIRCVGDPVLRFREDALRMFRALRFSAQLGFEVEAETRNALVLCAELSSYVSVERIREELEKTLLSDHPERVLDMISLGLLDRFSPNIRQDKCDLSSLPKIREVRWAGLCRVWADLDLRALRLDKQTAKIAMTAAQIDVPVDRLGWKRCIADYGESTASVCAALYGESCCVEEILASGECVCLRGLAVKGSDFPELKGKEVGKILQLALNHVLEHPEENDKMILVKILKNSIDYCY